MRLKATNEVKRYKTYTAIVGEETKNIKYRRVGGGLRP